jgi:hypothetical protein
MPALSMSASGGFDGKFASTARAYADTGTLPVVGRERSGIVAVVVGKVVRQVLFAVLLIIFVG